VHPKREREGEFHPQHCEVTLGANESKKLRLQKEEIWFAHLKISKSKRADE